MLDSASIWPIGLRVTDTSSRPVADARLKFYEAGTTTERVVYADAGLSVPLGAVVFTDAGGCPVTGSGSTTKTQIYTGIGSYKLRITTAADVDIVAPIDNISGALDTSLFGAGAGGMSRPVFSRTSDFTVDVNEPGAVYQCNSTGGTFTGTLPSALTAGNDFTVSFRHDGTLNQFKIAAVSGQTIKIPGGTTATGLALVGLGHAIDLVCDGAGWTVLQEQQPLIGSTVSKFQVVARQSSPPTAPNPGARYIISDTPTLAWLGRAIGDVAESDGNGGWIFYTPPANCGWWAYVQAEAVNYQWQGSAWSSLSNMNAPAASSLRRIVVGDYRTATGGAGTPTNNAWNPRTLNLTIFNSLTMANGASSDASLSSNAVTISAGRFRVTGWYQLYVANNSRTRFRSQTAQTSTTSLAIGTGSKAFTVSAGLSFAAGSRVMARSAGTANEVMEGIVASYVGTTLTVTVDSTLGSGTYSDWNIYNVINSTSDYAPSLSYGQFFAELILSQPDTFILESYYSGTTANGLGVPASIAGMAENYSAIEFLDMSSLQGPQGQQGIQGATGAGYQATSTTSLAIGTGSKAFTTQAGLAYLAGVRARARYDDTNYMEGVVASYSGTTLTLTVDRVVGSGTRASWNIGVAGDVGPTGTTGAAATIAVGTTTTGAAGSSASVTNSGSSSAATFNFTIPQGSQGNAGANGTDPGIRWLFASSTSMADPSAGNVRFNNATLGSITAAAISYSCGETGNPSVANWVKSLDDSTTTAHRGNLTVKKASAPQNYIIFDVTGALTDNTTWAQLALTVVDSAGSFSASDALSIQFGRTGDAGSGSLSGMTNNGMMYANGASSGTSTGAPTDGQILIGKTGLAPALAALSGDVTMTNAGVTAIGSSKVTNAMLAGSIDLTAKVTGVLPAANGGAGAVSGVMKANGSGTVSAATAGTGGDIVAPGTQTSFTKQQGFGIATLTDASSIAWDVSVAQSAKVTIAASRTISAVTNAVEGFVYTLMIIQDATGSRLITWTTSGSGSFDFGTDGAPTLTTTASKGDLVSFLAVSIGGTLKLRFCGIKKGFA